MTDIATQPQQPVTNLVITPSAQEYLKDLLGRQETPNMAVRVFVEHPGTPRAECCMAYSAPGEEDQTDLRIDFPAFAAFIEMSSVPYLLDAVIDYNKDRFGGQLTFKAPNSKVPRLGGDAGVDERINYVLQSEINPGLAGHGGNVQLLELFDDPEHGLTAVLQFGGGCQGCSAVDMTLKHGVESTLIAQIPELKRVIDKTDHTERSQAYFK